MIKSFDIDIMREAEDLVFGGIGSQRLYVATMVAVVLAAGVGLGVCLPNQTQIPEPWARVSAIVGWTYFATWSISFYPQLLVNYQRKSVVGLSFDFVVLNFLGFVSYAIYTCTLYTDREVQLEYRRRHGGQGNGVRLNDVIFALHACAATAVVMLQILIYERGNQKLSKTCLAITAAIVAGCGGVLLAAQSNAFPDIQELDLMYVVGFIKVGITFAKYLPQVLLNFRRKSTDGFAIGPILCDITGSVLSIGQQALDSIALGDWSVMFGNIIKLGIGLVGIVYDLILMFQHYVLYPGDSDAAALLQLRPGAKEPLPQEEAELRTALVAEGHH